MGGLMTRERLRSIALWLALAGALGSALEADGGKAKNVILEGRVPAQTGPGSIRFSIDTSPIIFYLTTVNGKYHALLLRVKNDTGAPLALSKDQDSIALTFADGQHVQGLLNLPPVDRATWDGLETEIRTAIAYPDLVPAREEEGIYVYVRVADIKTPRLRHEMPMSLTYTIKSLPRPVEVRQRATAKA
jgi:hypothetical protein